MYLKSIEIQGFKSFANKALLEFNEGVTGIVGPNGSGKSNIADAVRWVLGEQKVKQLRGGSMQDVIFSGTELRKPQGFAYVAITLDNSDRRLPVDFNEVTVSRRLYRSGESEYMINKTACRLKDINELFYDTGIGKEGYSIIGQGQIDAILNGKPEERRYLFDEAAGIVKFKRRKAIAEKKLESERANLLRISDILSELERQVGPLKKQAESAKEYLRLRDEQRVYDLNLFIRDSDELLAELKKLKESESIADASLEDAKKALEELRQSYDNADREVSSLESLINERKNELSRGENYINSLNSQISISEEQIKADENSIVYFNDRLSAVDNEINSKEKTVLSYFENLSALSEQLELVKEKQAESGAQSLSDAGISDTGLSELSDKISDFKNRIKKLLNLSEDEIPVFESGVDKEDIPKDENEDEPDEFMGASWLSGIRTKQNELSEIKEREERVKNWLNLSVNEYNSISEEVKRLNRAINDRQQEYHRSSTKLESLRNIAERYEGYGQSVKKVMETRGRVHGIRGVVADIIKTKKEYETAIETALGGSLQNIVTDSEETAKVLVEYLKKNKFGRATFLPLDAVRARTAQDNDAALKEPGVIGRASELTEVSDEYRELNDYLLRRTVVVDNIDNAIRLARKFKHSLKIVTLDGELLNPGGSISGGAYKNSSNLMGRQREIDELTAEIEKILKQVDSLNEQIVKKEKELDEKGLEADRLKNELNEISIEKNTISLGIISDMQLQYSELSQKTGFISENIQRLESELTKLEDEREGLLSRRSESTSGIGEKKEYIKGLRGDIENAQSGIAALKEEILEKEAEKEKRSASRKEFFSRREELSTDILGMEKELMRLKNREEKLQSELDSATEYIWSEYELTVSGAKEYYREDIGDKADIKKRVSELKSAIKALGPVNIQAVEDYKEISERYEFLKAQHDDLTESEKSIVAVIEELDAGMKRQFEEKFALIKAEFDKVFKELFGGGKGELELVTEDGGDILSAGIAIIAQPPGKKLQNMMQLSGGEKALTAISLLFAIQNLKPSPFCLLDEIEAALDDSNVGRFAGYLHRLTEHTQFIIITHRRGTMEAADRLYGVTMQEKGVTALVSVDLVADKLEN